MRNQVIKTIEKEKLIAIIRGVEKEKLIKLVRALYYGGVKLVEVTYSANGKVSDEETAQMIAMLVEEFKGQMYIGAGTVLNEKQVELTKNAGGCFIISPDVDEDVIKKTSELEMVSLPGALTPTEIKTAMKYGADFVKIFPTTSLGSSYIKAIKAPLSNAKLLAVGGVDENNLAEFYKAGVCGFGVGTNITDKKMIAENDYTGITALAFKYTNAIKNLK